MKRKTICIALAAVALLVAAGYAGFEAGLRRAGQPAAAPAASALPAQPQAAAEGEAATRRHIAAGLKAGDTDPLTGRRILYYQDPMVPGKRFEQPGKSPFMDMLLVPVYAEGEADAGQVAVSPRLQQNLGLRSAAVTEGPLAPQLSAVGSIAFNERDQAIVQARATGFVERLHVRATLDRVAAGQPLVDLYVPDWVAAQEEYLALRRMPGPDLAPLVEGARQRMRQAGMSEAQIRRVESTGQTQSRITLVAPVAGVVAELMAREGMTVMAGATLLRINGLSTVWAQAEVPETQAAWLRPGAKVLAQSPALPGTRLEGRVQALLPEVDPATRTLKARLELANPGGRLVPGMFVSMQFLDLDPKAGAKALLVPSEALIQTGRRSVVIVAEEGGRFRVAEVEAGLEAGGQTEIRRGLQAGQRVVVSSQFLIDSEASLRGVEARLNAGEAPAAAAPGHEGEGRIEAIEPDALTLSHGPIPALKWGAMTMEFKPPPQGLPAGLKVGDRVRFEFRMDADGAQLTRLTPLAPAPQRAGSRP